jgi:hypothetical protein
MGVTGRPKRPEELNLDDLITTGMQDPHRFPLAYELAKNLIVWRKYATELQGGIKNLENMLDKADRARRAGL